MFNRDLRNRERQPPTAEELAYVRALVLPLEQALPPDPNNRPKIVFKLRPFVRMRDDQIVLECGKCGPDFAIPGQLARDRIASRKQKSV